MTLVEAALRALAEDPSARVLLAAPREYSADILAARLGEAAAAANPAANLLLLPPGSLLRAIDPRRPPSQAAAEALPYAPFSEEAAAFRWPDPEEVRAARAVVATCVSCARLVSSAERFTHVFIDEVRKFF